MTGDSVETAKSVKHEITEPMRFYFRQLVPGGLHGDIPTEIVRTLVRDQIKHLVENGQLKKPPDGQG